MLPLRDHNPSGQFPIITIGLIALNFFGFLQELTASNLEAFVGQYALTPALVDFGQTETLFPFFTSMFLHAGWLHLLSNMWFLWIFGDNIEERFGRIRFIFFYLAAGIAAGLAQYAVDASSMIPMLGASGAVAGVLGAYLVFFPRHTIDTLIPFFGFIRIMPLPAMVMIGYWFLIQLLSGVGSLAAQTAATGGVAFFAHIGGFIAGVILAKISQMR